METGPARSVLREIRTLFTLGTLGGLTDAELLDLFLSRDGDDAEEAFAALVHRHAPMVLGVCRRMLPSSHDAEDAFQAAFFILARRAASIRQREQLASWLHGVAIRTASEARRRAARQRVKEKRLMERSRIEWVPAEERNDLLPFLDEELNRLPKRYRAALVACELEGKSRSEAAHQLGLPEGTLSTHLARGRKLLRERLVRRGVNLGIGPGAVLPRPVIEPLISERLADSAVQSALRTASGTGATGTAARAVASLAERVIRAMFLTKLFLVFSHVMAAGTATMFALGLIVVVAGPPSDPIKPGAADLSGRVLDQAGAVVANAQVWAAGGFWDAPETVATAITDGQGRFVLLGAWDHPAAKEAIAGGRFGLLARAPDGRVGWLTAVSRKDAAGKENTFEIAVGPVAEVQGRVIDQNGQPIAGASVWPVEFIRPGKPGSGDSFKLNPEAAIAYRTGTGADGSFVIKGAPQGARVRAAFGAEGVGELRFAWDSTRPVTFTLDNRLGQIKGHIKVADVRGLAGQISGRAQLRESPGNPAAQSNETMHYRVAPVGADGSFELNDLPSGRYLVNLLFDGNPHFVAQPGKLVEVGPGALAEVNLPLVRVSTITGRVVNAETGKGIAGIPIHCYRLENEVYVQDAVQAQTDADGQYSIVVTVGVVKIRPEELPKAYLVPKYRQSPDLEVGADQRWPDLKLARATTLNGIVVDENEQPVVGAELYVVATDRGGERPKNEMMRTGPGGTFHVEQLDPEDTVSLWARTIAATTHGAIKVRPREIQGGILELTINPKFACRIRGRTTDGAGKRIAGAKVKLWWNRPCADQNGQINFGHAIPLDSYVTHEDGWFLFRGLWPNFQYGPVIDAGGYSKVEGIEVIGKSGETHDLGKLVLCNTSGHIAGQVVGSDGQPLSGATVFNYGDGPTAITASTDSQGRFRLGPLYAGMKYAFIRKQGYRFTGVKVDADADDLPITVLASSEPPPAWKPDAGARFDGQRAFAKRMLVRLWEKYGANGDEARGIECIAAMAPIDLPLATKWAAERGHRYDGLVRQAAAEKMAQTERAGPWRSCRRIVTVIYNHSFRCWPIGTPRATTRRRCSSPTRRRHAPAGWSRPGGRLPWHRPVPRWLDRGEPNADARSSRRPLNSPRNWAPTTAGLLIAQSSPRHLRASTSNGHWPSSSRSRSTTRILTSRSSPARSRRPIRAWPPTWPK